MSKKAPPIEKPKITTFRSVALEAKDDACNEVNLGHLAELVRTARERGYADDTRVSIYDARGTFYRTLRITISDGN